MKRIFTGLAALLALLILAGCGGQTIPPEGPTGDPSVTEPITDPAVQPEQAEGPYLYYTSTHGQLYAQPVSGGNPIRVVESDVLTFRRWGEDVLALTYNGAVLRTRPGAAVEKVAQLNGDAGSFLVCEGGLIYGTFSMTEGDAWYYYDYATGQSRPLGVEGNLYQAVVAENTLIYPFDDPDEDYRLKLATLDLDTMAGGWCVSAGEDSNAYVSQFYTDGTNVWAEICTWWDGDYDRTVYRVDLADGALTIVDLPFDTDLYHLRAMAGSGGCLVEGDSHYTPYFVDASGEIRTLPLVLGDWSFMTPDAGYDKVLLQVHRSGVKTILDQEVYTYRQYRYLLSLADGSVTEVTSPGVDGALFAAGDFPVIDSSTARKPVTLELYNYFCLENGIDGAEPLCSTTHNAWLNIADRVADIALLAAPTDEEQAYLKEKGVDVEMKLYGGDGLVFIGNRACGAKELTIEEVQGIYRGEITNWAQVGGVDHPIRVLYRDDQSGSQRLFEKLLFRGQEVPDMEALGFERLDGMSTIVGECLYDPYAIGYSIMTYLNDVYGQEDLLCFPLNGVEATPANVASGDYPLGTKGYVVIRADEPADSPARRLYDWFGGGVSDNILTGCGVTPLHAD